MFIDIIKFTHCHLCNKKFKQNTRCDDCRYDDFNLCHMNDTGIDLGLKINNKIYIFIYDFKDSFAKIKQISNRRLSEKEIIVNYDYNLQPNIKENLERLIKKYLKLNSFA